MEKLRFISRSIIIDPVNTKIDKTRFAHHQISLDKISHAHNTDFFSRDKNSSEYYLKQLERFKRSISYVRNLFNHKNMENEVLMKKMVEIDRRKNSYSSL